MECKNIDNPLLMISEVVMLSDSSFIPKLKKGQKYLKKLLRSILGNF